MVSDEEVWETNLATGKEGIYEECAETKNVLVISWPLFFLCKSSSSCSSFWRSWMSGFCEAMFTEQSCLELEGLGGMGSRNGRPRVDWVVDSLRKMDKPWFPVKT
jgi:hypothetical protein